MSVYTVSGGFRYDFWRGGRRYASEVFKGGAKAREECRAAEQKKKTDLQRGVHGLDVRPDASPRFDDWAPIYLDHAINKKGNDPDTMHNNMAMVLRFFGKRPEKSELASSVGKRGRDKRGISDPRPYHNLRLSDPIADPSWVLKFEDHLDARRIKGSTKNASRSTLNQMYKLAMGPRHSALTGVRVNPFAVMPRDKAGRRTKMFGAPQNLTAVLDAAAPHVRLAMHIALFAPGFRRGSILRLEWAEREGTRETPAATAWIDDEMTYMVDTAHKTVKETGEPIVEVISPELRKILKAEKARQQRDHAKLVKRYGSHTPCPSVIQYKSRPVAEIKNGFQKACKRAGVTYGLYTGVTFHTLRHEGGTEAARITGLSDAMHQGVLNQKTNRASQIYRHLVPEHKRPAMLELGKRTAAKLAAGRRANG